jgi:hypothetical protein
MKKHKQNQTHKVLYLPKRYVPAFLTKSDAKKQIQNLLKTRKKYLKGVYEERPKLKSYVHKPSPHLKRVQEIYGMDVLDPRLPKAAQCSPEAFEQILNKGRGAYYSSGSRPNQTAESWAVARLASSVTGGKASAIDRSILEEGCKPGSKALRLAQKTRKHAIRKRIIT